MTDRPRIAHVGIAHVGIAHVGIAVPDIDAALPFYRDVLGLEPHPPETSDGAAIVSLPFGDSEVELLAPLEPERRSPRVAPPATGWSMRRPGPAPGAAGSPSCIPRRRRASFSS